MKREELNDYRLPLDGSFIVGYSKSEADKVMDAMEARIKELESEVKKWKQDNGYLSAIIQLLYKGKDVNSAEVIAVANRMDKLESENARLKSIVGDDEYKQGLSGLAQRNAELREENERLKAANFDIKSHFDVLKEDYEELKAQVPKWHSGNFADGDLPTRSDMFCVLFHSEDEERRLIRSACYYFADEDGDSRFGEWEFDRVEKWCELPLPPTNEESSVTEKENR